MFTSRLRYLTAGESPGPSLTGVLDGMPAGVPLEEETVARDLARRQRGLGAGGRMKIERDTARITAGVMAGRTTGGPIAFTIENRDFANWRDKDIKPMTVPRPGHADLTGAAKYGYRDLRLSLERASARETAMRVAVGAACRALLLEFGVEVGGYVTGIGAVSCADEEPASDPAKLRARFVAAEANDVRCPDPSTYAAMQDAIEATIRDKDTLGGVVETFAIGVPVGLGSYVQADRRLDARLAGALMSVNAAKGVEVDGTTAEQEIIDIALKVDDEFVEILELGIVSPQDAVQETGFLQRPDLQVAVDVLVVVIDEDSGGAARSVRPRVGKRAVGETVSPTEGEGGTSLSAIVNEVVGSIDVRALGEEANGAQSKADFTAKMYIACKEARETLYWLRLIAATELINSERPC